MRVLNSLGPIASKMGVLYRRDWTVQLQTRPGVASIKTWKLVSWCQTILTNLSTQEFGNAEKELKEKTKQLEVLQKNEGAHNWGEIRTLQGETESILEQDGINFHQY
jgi:hypothetical protein